MNGFLQKGDGSGRAFRDVQVKALTWLEENWDKYDVFCLNAPTGSGKSMIARTVQNTVGGAIVTASNVLLDQYVEEYGMNFLKGREHYVSPDGLECSEECPIVMRQRPCAGCPYKAARARADAGEPTVFNPASLYYLHGGEIPRDATIIDEAHLLPGFIQQLCATSFSRSKWQWKDNVLSEIEFTNWLTTLVGNANKWLAWYDKSDNKEGFKKEYKVVCKCLDSWSRTLKAYKESPELFAMWIDSKTVRGKKEDYLNVQPILPIKSFCDSILGRGKIILMSGTLFDIDIKALVGDRRYGYIELESPIPSSQRPIYFRPLADSISVQTPPETIAKGIETIIGENPGTNALVHISYSDSGRVLDHLHIPVFTNDKRSKASTLSKFTTDGGVFLASGCAEGINLPDDKCRVIYIPRLLKPNLGDPVVKKRMALEDGQRWYDLTVLKNAIQSVGRGARHEKDWCNSYIGDPSFSRLVLKYFKIIPKGVLESIKWG